MMQFPFVEMNESNEVEQTTKFVFFKVIIINKNLFFTLFSFCLNCSSN